jgi:hypothetical protein
MFKVLAAIPKRDGGHWWMRCGSGHVNKDDSINVYLDVIPKDFKFQLRELDDEDLKRREQYRATHGGGLGNGVLPGLAAPSGFGSSSHGVADRDGDGAAGDAPPF